MNISPSILAADWSQLRKEVSLCTDVGVNALHIDVMDGHFVEQITFGPKFIKDMRVHTDLFFDVHIMISNPEKHVDAIIESGADALTFHIEATKFSFRLISYIKEKYPKVKIGLALNPQTSVDSIIPVFSELDIILLMSVEPGFGGQSFIPYTLEKIKMFHDIKKRQNSKAMLSIDGGVNLDTAPALVSLGVDTLVMGSAFFSAENKKELISKIRAMK